VRPSKAEPSQAEPCQAKAAWEERNLDQPEQPKARPTHASLQKPLPLLKAPNVALSVTLAAARPLAAAPLTPSRHLATYTFGALVLR